MALVQPSPELQINIRKQLNEDVSTRDSDLQIIKDWLRKQPHLPDTWDENRMMTFLRGCKFSLEKCKRKLDMYFTMRAAIPEFFRDRDIRRPELQQLTKIAQGPALPGLTKEGYRVTVMRSSVKELQETPNMADAFKVALMLGDIRLAAEEVGVAGDVYVLDASVLSVQHFSKVTPALVKKFLVCVQEAYPVKLKQVHVVHVSPLVDTVIGWVKPFLKEKIRSRIHVHATLDSLYAYLPREVLPVEYGGSAGKLEDFHRDWLRKMEEYGPWFKQQESIVADESRRPGKPTNYDDLFGLDGSFRQLKID